MGNFGLAWVSLIRNVQKEITHTNTHTSTHGLMREITKTLILRACELMGSNKFKEYQFFVY